MDKKQVIRLVYLYLFTAVGLVLMIIGAVQFIDLGLKTYVFTKADENYSYPEYPVKTVSPDGKQVELTPEQQAKYDADKAVADKANQESQRQRTASTSLALLIIGSPLFLYHWGKVQAERKTV